jgi:hypothetical protein
VFIARHSIVVLTMLAACSEPIDYIIVARCDDGSMQPTDSGDAGSDASADAGNDGGADASGAGTIHVTALTATPRGSIGHSTERPTR